MTGVSGVTFAVESTETTLPSSKVMLAGLVPSGVTTWRDRRICFTSCCCYTTVVLRQNEPEHWMEMAIQLAIENVTAGLGGPFGAVVVKDDQLVATGVNRVTAENDPTAHAEVVAIRAACQKLSNFQLAGCELYSSCEPCPMCLGAIYWARLNIFYYACTRAEAAAIGFDDAYIYDELALTPSERSIPGRCLLPDRGQQAFVEWANSTRKIAY